MRCLRAQVFVPGKWHTERLVRTNWGDTVHEPCSCTFFVAHPYCYKSPKVNHSNALRKPSSPIVRPYGFVSVSLITLTFMADNNRNKDGSRDHKDRRGFASMDEAKQREIASKGGKAAHAKGTAHEFTSEEAREAGRKGGSSRG